MRNWKLLVPALFVPLVAACATMTASAHIERGVTFEDYVTYDWGPADSLPVGDPRLDNNPFFNDQLQGAIEKSLAAKGYERVLQGVEPDLLIHYHAAVNQKVDVTRVDNNCYQNCEPQFSEYEQGTLVVDIVDPKTNRVVWRGWAQDSVTGVIDNQDRLDHKVQEGVAKMMMFLPRGGAALR